MVITVVCTPGTQAREAGHRFKKIWCLLSGGGRNVEERRGAARAEQRAALKDPRNTNLTRVHTGYFFISSATAALKTLNHGQS